jgi:hypothetical protein
MTQEDLAVLLCSSKGTIRRDIKELKVQGIEVPTRGTLQDIGPGVTHKSKVVKMWLEGYEYPSTVVAIPSRKFVNRQTCLRDSFRNIWISMKPSKIALSLKYGFSKSYSNPCHLKKA